MGDLDFSTCPKTPTAVRQAPPKSQRTLRKRMKLSHTLTDATIVPGPMSGYHLRNHVVEQQVNPTVTSATVRRASKKPGVGAIQPEHRALRRSTGSGGHRSARTSTA